MYERVTVVEWAEETVKRLEERFLQEAGFSYNDALYSNPDSVPAKILPIVKKIKQLLIARRQMRAMEELERFRAGDGIASIDRGSDLGIELGRIAQDEKTWS